ncbi:MAG TPA: glycoside hydrolase family 43 protein [Longimicrobium sp.]
MSVFAGREGPAPTGAAPLPGTAAARVRRVKARPARGAAVFALALLAGAAACGGGGDGGGGGGITPPPPTPACSFTNPLAQGADPWVVRDAGFYYLVQSRDNGIWVSKSSTLTGVTQNQVRVWSAPATGWNRTNVWAPELHPIDGRWYIYYAAGSDGPPFVSQRSGVLESAGSDPMGPYTDRGMLFTGNGGPGSGNPNVWAIDVTVARIGTELYAVWSGWEANASIDRTPQHLYAAHMSNPWTIDGPRGRISSPVESWERGTELDLQEGPQFLQRNGQTFIVYSTRESWLPDYRLGLLRLVGADPLNPASWVKTGPVFQAAGTVYGPGHASFTTSPDGTQSWIVYHAKVASAPGWDRVIRAQPFTWNADGTPAFGTPVPSGQAIPRPSGECTG